MRRQLVRSNINPLSLPHFFFAGKSVLTFQNQEKGTHITVKSTQARDKADRKIKLPYFFIKVRVLGDKESGFVFAGTIFQDSMRYALSSKVNEGEQIDNIMKFLMTALKRPAVLKERHVSLLHEGHCCRCGLPLTHPESIDTGFGPDCLKTVLAANEGLDFREFFEKIVK
jgi:hypothetical protein